VSKNTKRGESFHEPTMQHLHKIINKYDKLAKEAKD